MNDDAAKTIRQRRHRCEQSGSLPLDLFPADRTEVERPFRDRLRRCYTFPAQGGVLFTAETLALHHPGDYAAEPTALLPRPDDTAYAIDLPPTYLHLPDQSTWSSLGHEPTVPFAAAQTSKVPLVSRGRRRRRWRASIAAACLVAGTLLLALGWRTFLC
jgi:hypothetical protein